MANPIPTTTYISKEVPAEFSKCCNKPAVPLMVATGGGSGGKLNKSKIFHKQDGWKCTQCHNKCEVYTKQIKTVREVPVTRRYGYD